MFSDAVPMNMKLTKKWQLLLWHINAWRWHTWEWFTVKILVLTEIDMSCNQLFNWFFKVLERSFHKSVYVFRLVRYCCMLILHSSNKMWIPAKIKMGLCLLQAHHWRAPMPTKGPVRYKTILDLSSDLTA